MVTAWLSFVVVDVCNAARSCVPVYSWLRYAVGVHAAVVNHSYAQCSRDVVVCECVFWLWVFCCFDRIFL